MSILSPNINTFTAGGTVSKGQIVKHGSTDKLVVASSAATDKHVGVAQNDATSGQPVEVAMPGGGAKIKLGGTVALGDSLTSDASGLAVATTTANDKVIAQAMEAGAVNELRGANCVYFNY